MKTIAIGVLVLVSSRLRISMTNSRPSPGMAEKQNRDTEAETIQYSQGGKGSRGIER